MLKGKKIILGITGSIAAYKACYIIRGLIKQGAEVQVIITPAGKEFITPITLSALTSKPVISEFFAQRDGTWNSHVDLGLWADAVLIAPATASTIGKMANGIADNMLITTYLSSADSTSTRRIRECFVLSCTGPVINVTCAPRRAHSSANANPIFPEE